MALRGPALCSQKADASLQSECKKKICPHCVIKDFLSHTDTHAHKLKVGHTHIHFACAHKLVVTLYLCTHDIYCVRPQASCNTDNMHIYMNTFTRIYIKKHAVCTYAHSERRWNAYVSYTIDSITVIHWMNLQSCRVKVLNHLLFTTMPSQNTFRFTGPANCNTVMKHKDKSTPGHKTANKPHRGLLYSSCCYEWMGFCTSCVRVFWWLCA